MADDVGMVARIYERAGLPMTREVRERARRLHGREPARQARPARVRPAGRLRVGSRGGARRASTTTSTASGSRWSDHDRTAAHRNRRMRCHRELAPRCHRPRRRTDDGCRGGRSRGRERRPHRDPYWWGGVRIARRGTRRGRIRSRAHRRAAPPPRGGSVESPRRGNARAAREAARADDRSVRPAARRRAPRAPCSWWPRTRSTGPKC